jgi:transposase
MTPFYLGIDIAQASFDVVLLMDEQRWRGHFANDPSGLSKLARWLDKRGASQVHACLEATNRYGEEVASFLHEQGHCVSVVNPKVIQKHSETIGQRNKSDAQDALTIADYCAKHRPAPWTPPPAAVRQLQALVRHVQALQSDRQREANRRATAQAAEVLAAIDAHLAFIDEQIAALQQRIRDHIDQHPDLKQGKALLTSIPGVGEAIATTFLAEVGDVARFAQATQLDAYAGLTPGQRQSGTSLRGRGKLVKWGNARLRTVFYMPALSAHRWNPLVAALRDRLLRQGKPKMTVVVAVMRKLLHLCYGVLKTGKPFDLHHRSSSLLVLDI